MRLVVTVATLDPHVALEKAEVEKALWTSASAYDGVEHIYLKTEASRWHICLYMHDAPEVTKTGEQLVRRTLAGMDSVGGWSIESSRTAI